LTPIASHTVPAGQGLVGLSLYLGLGGGSLAAFTVALVVVFLALLVSFIVTYPALKPWAVLAPALVLFFSARSFGSYLVTLIPATIVAASTTRSQWMLPVGEVSPETPTADQPVLGGCSVVIAARSSWPARSRRVPRLGPHWRLGRRSPSS